MSTISRDLKNNHVRVLATASNAIAHTLVTVWILDANPVSYEYTDGWRNSAPHLEALARMHFDHANRRVGGTE